MDFNRSFRKTEAFVELLNSGNYLLGYRTTKGKVANLKVEVTDLKEAQASSSSFHHHKNE